MFVIYESSAAFRIRDIKDENSIIIFEQSWFCSFWIILQTTLIDFSESLVMLRDNASSFTWKFYNIDTLEYFTFMNKERGWTD